MAVEFYDVKKREKVQVDEKNITKTIFKNEQSGRTTYALRGKHDGRTMTKFVSKAAWDEMKVKEE